MPVLLHEEDYDLWLRGSLEDVMSFQGRCYPDELIQMERTPDPWLRRNDRAEVVSAG
jgi:putative SOS response-associated peptidase YedK